MSKDYLKYLKSLSKELAKKHNIFDVVIYGSSVKGKEEPRDIDLLLIFEDKKLKERVEIAQELKEKAHEKIKGIDVKTINLKELFEKEYLARQAIFTEGYSLIHNSPFSERLGFEGYALFTYTLTNLDHNKKNMFTYALIGRKKEGIKKQLKAQSLGKGAIIIPTKNSLIFENFLQKWGITFKKKSILVSTA